MGIAQNACHKCGKRGGLAKMAGFGKEKVPGSLCKKCGQFIADKQSRTRDVSCDGCHKALGSASNLVDVFVDGKLAHKGEEQKKFMCPPCSGKRVQAGTHDVDEVLTRYESKCMGGCGKIQGLIDAPEGTERVDLNVGYCEPCTPKAREVESNEKAIDELVKNVSGQ